MASVELDFCSAVERVPVCVCVQLSFSLIHTQNTVRVPVSALSYGGGSALPPDEHSDHHPHTNKISFISLPLVRVQGLQSSFLLLPSLSSSR